MTADEFYVGYRPQAPSRLKRFLNPIVVSGIVAASAVAAVVAVSQARFDPSSFEYGVTQDFAGVATRDPVPVLFTQTGAHLLFGQGKHAFSGDLPAGVVVRLRGSILSHGEYTGIEVQELSGREAGAQELPHRIPLGAVAVTGEIVDSKCYLGVMNPGRGKVHRDCAVRCISGGIPAALLVRDGSGTFRLLVLSGLSPEALRPYIGERVRVSGDLSRMGSMLLLHTYTSSLEPE